MTPNEIRNKDGASNPSPVSAAADTIVQFQIMGWLKEIAYQLAVFNERETSKPLKRKMEQAISGPAWSHTPVQGEPNAKPR